MLDFISGKYLFSVNDLLDIFDHIIFPSFNLKNQYNIETHTKFSVCNAPALRDAGASTPCIPAPERGNNALL